MNNEIFNSIENLHNAINGTGYICSKQLTLTVYLAYHLNKSIVLMGPPGVGKTEIAKVISNLLNDCDPIRLQCYEGITSSEAIYDWDFKKQLLYIESTKGDAEWKNMQTNIYGDEFLSERPLLKSILNNKKEVLLIDELDKSDEEFEAFLLEFLAENQITISENNKTIKSKYQPLCFITSNDQRQLSDALLRRCLFIYIDYPSIKTEVKIVHSKAEGINDLLATQIVYFVNKIRSEKIKKLPSISETIDWARTLVKLEKNNLDTNLVKNTLNVLLKNKDDIDLIKSKTNQLLDNLPDKAIEIEKIKHKTKEIKIEDDDWNF